MRDAQITIGVLSEPGAGHCNSAADATGRLAAFLSRVCSFPVMLGALLVGITFSIVKPFLVDPDMWWHVRMGEFILATHRWASSDPYSYTSAGAPWMSAEWLGDVSLATFYRLGGLRGLHAIQIVLAGTVILALYIFVTLRSGNCKAAFIVSTLLVPLASISFNVRPQMFGYLFLILTLIALERFRQGNQRAIWMLPLMFLVWVNTHGSWIIGLGTVGIYIASGLMTFELGSLTARSWTAAQRLRLETVFMLSVAAISITPYGVELAAYPFTVASSLPVSIANVNEWQVMPFDLAFGKIFLALVLGLFLAQVAFRFSWRLEEFLLFLIGTAMACLHARFLLLFVPFFAPIGGSLLARWAPGYIRAKDKYLLNFAVMAGIVFAMVHYFPSQPEIERKIADRFPVRALEYMREHPIPGPLFNNYNFGGYMIHAGYKTFIDGRSELFEQTGVLEDYLHIVKLAPGALHLLSRYGIRSCLLKRDEPLSVVLASQPDWQKLYSDNVSALYVKRSAADDPEQTIATTLSAIAR